MLNKCGFSSETRAYLKKEWQTIRYLLDDYTEKFEDYIQNFVLVDSDEMTEILKELFYQDGFQAGVDNFDSYCVAKRREVILFTDKNGAFLLNKENVVKPSSYQEWLCESD